jgi:hypothetical protein
MGDCSRIEHGLIIVVMPAVVDVNDAWVSQLETVMAS